MNTILMRELCCWVVSLPVLFYLQRLRDEAHRFAIGIHRGKRSSSLSRSILDEVAGVGQVRKKALLRLTAGAGGDIL
jgi:excinuclease ABC subunit C